MSKTNELLNNLSNDEIMLYTVNPETEPHIVVGEDRIVVVPEELRNIAVQRDHLIETVTFDCPRFWDGHDMSKMVIYVNYLPPDGEVGAYICDNICVDENNPDIMHFDWTITENATINEGRLIFLVDIKGENGEHWHSELNEDMYVSEGIEPPPFVDVANPDILTQVLLFNANVTELNRNTLNRAAVYVGSGEMPEGYNVQVDPEGDSDFDAIVRHTAETIAGDATEEYLRNYAPAIYVGSGNMPKEYVIQIDPEGDEVYSLTEEEKYAIANIVIQSLPNTSGDYVGVDGIYYNSETGEMYLTSGNNKASSSVFIKGGSGEGASRVKAAIHGGILVLTQSGTSDDGETDGVVDETTIEKIVEEKIEEIMLNGRW